MYPRELTEPMRRELLDLGFEDLRTPGHVERFMSESGTALVVINSVCGCAAGNARPAVRLALENAKRPDRIGTVFAGVDPDATQAFRNRIPDVPPSSPSIYLFKNRELVWLLPRHMIEGRDAQEIAADIVEAFEKHCGEPVRK